MVIKICQMGDKYNASLTFRVCIDNSVITYYESFKYTLKTYKSADMDRYIRTSSFHKDYGNFLYTGTL